MDTLYKIIDTLLPFQWVEFDFMKNALIAILLVTPVFGIVGTMIVNSKMAFFSDALGHGAFTGIALGGVIGIVKPMWAAVIFSLIFAIVITKIKSNSRASVDTIIGVFSSTTIAIGIVIASFGGSNFNKYNSYLIGDLLSINKEELFTLLLVLLWVVLIWFIIFNKLLVISINPSLAKSRGVKIQTIELIFTCIIAAIVTISIHWVGLLIINSMLVLPAAAARNISLNSRQYLINTLIIGLISGVGGLILSYYWNTATGATIVIFSSVIYFGTYAVRERFS